MSRGIGGVELVQELLPEWAALLAALLTQLGDSWFLGLVLVSLYWTRRENGEDVVLVAGLLFVGTGIYRTLKHVLALPRPNAPLLDPAAVPSLVRPLYEAAAFSQSYGFPSGHATGSAAVYVGLAAVLTVGTRRGRYAVAGLLVTVVSLTRVVLGLHYVVDVVAGACLGAGLVYVTVRGRHHLGRDAVTPVLFAAVIATACYLGASGTTTQSYGAVGGALGLLAGWQVVVLGQGPTAPATTGNAGEPAAWRRWTALGSVVMLLSSLVAAVFVPGEATYLAGVAGAAAVFVVVAPMVRNPGRLRRGLAALGP